MIWYRSLADSPKAMRKLAVHLKDESGTDVFDPDCRHSLVRAPCCGRHRRADSIVALHGLVTVFRGGNHLPPENHDWACTECLHILVHDKANGWTWSKLWRALGAPADVIRHERAREIAEAKRLDDHQNGRSHKPDDAFASALAGLPHGVRELPGTERPDV